MTERGKNRDTAFAEWWEISGRHMARIISGGSYSEQMKIRKYTQAGYIWGWMDRAKRDAKKRQREKASRT